MRLSFFWKYVVDYMNLNADLHKAAFSLLLIVFLLAVNSHIAQPQKTGEEDDYLADFIRQCDERQYYLPAEGVSSFAGSFKIILPEGIAEVDDVDCRLNVAWDTKNKYETGLYSTDWEILNPDNIDDIYLLLNNLILGRNLSLLLKGYECEIQHSKRTHIITAQNRKKTPSYLKLWIDDEMRITRALINSQTISKMALEFRNTDADGKWLIGKILVDYIQTKDDSYLEQLKTIEITYAKCSSGMGQKIRFPSLIKMIGKQTEEEGGHLYHTTVKLEKNSPSFLPIYRSSQDIKKYVGSRAVFIGEFYYDNASGTFEEKIRLKDAFAIIGKCSKEPPSSSAKTWKIFTAKVLGVSPGNQVLIKDIRDIRIWKTEFR
ncbi:hypothetical protein ACFL54_09305 [Planctomycetota bacterium]